MVRNPDGGSVPFVKRLIGLPGDVVELRNEVLFVNGKAQKVEFLSPRTLADGEIEILGTEGIDGRTASRSVSSRKSPRSGTSARSRFPRERSS